VEVESSYTGQLNRQGAICAQGPAGKDTKDAVGEPAQLERLGTTTTALEITVVII
jgi:hypothetical protein